MYIEWVVLYILSLIVDVLGVVTVPIALAFCDEDDEHLPDWALPWDNARDGINGDGVSGVNGWRGPEHANGRERTFWWRFLWLVYRNPANNFGYLLGRTPRGAFRVRTNNPGEIGDQSGEAGWKFVTCSNCWTFYAIWPWSASRCLRVALGWKIWDQSRERAQIVLVINPFKAYSAAKTEV